MFVLVFVFVFTYVCVVIFGGVVCMNQYSTGCLILDIHCVSNIQRIIDMLKRFHGG